MTARNPDLVLPRTKKPLKQISREAAIYFAGFFDGEGCINICEREQHHGGPGQVGPIFRCEMSVSNTHQGVLEQIISMIGGNLHKQHYVSYMKNGQPRKPLWRWGAGQAETQHILKQILPFLIVKREQAELAMVYYESVNKLRNQPHPGRIGKLRISPEEVESRRQFVAKMKQLKRLSTLESST